MTKQIHPFSIEQFPITRDGQLPLVDKISRGIIFAVDPSLLLTLFLRLTGRFNFADFPKNRENHEIYSREFNQLKVIFLHQVSATNNGESFQNLVTGKTKSLRNLLSIRTNYRRHIVTYILTLLFLTEIMKIDKCEKLEFNQYDEKSLVKPCQILNHGLLRDIEKRWK